MTADRPNAPSPYANPYLAGLGLGLVLLAAFVLVGRGLGASGGVNALVAASVNAVAPSHAQRLEWLANYLAPGTNPLKEWLLFEIVGVFAGALLSGLLARRVRLGVDKGPRVSTGLRLGMAFAGGTLMAVGAAFARGCTSGQALTGGSLLNLGSWAFMMMVFAGAYGVASLVRWQWR
ncbi:MAG: putative transporter component [Acidobacteria bacterium]|nr:putative transporter component [Acidobacteriota bacterium]